MVQDSNKENSLENKEKEKADAIEKQEKSDPQLTELRGFIDPEEDLEPTLQDGKKSPDKADEEYEKE